MTAEERAVLINSMGTPWGRDIAARFLAKGYEEAIAKAVAVERERCAKIAEALPWTDDEMNYGTRERIAEAIRATGTDAAGGGT